MSSELAGKILVGIFLFPCWSPEVMEPLMESLLDVFKIIVGPLSLV